MPNSLSRRLRARAYATLALSPISFASAVTKTRRWRQYRRDDLGFEVEMPGTPKIQENTDQGAVYGKGISAVIEVEDVLFVAVHVDLSRPTSITELLSFEHSKLRALMATTGSVKSKFFITNGLIGAEIITDLGELSRITIKRSVTVGSSFFEARAHFAHSSRDNRSIRRFLNSFKLTTRHQQRIA